MDLNELPSLKRITGAPIVIHKRRQTNEKEKSFMVNIAIIWVWQDPMINYKRRQEISQAACMFVAGDYGFEKTYHRRKLLNGFYCWMVTLMKARMIRCYPVTLVLMRTWGILSPDTEAISTRFSEIHRSYTDPWQSFNSLMI